MAKDTKFGRLGSQTLEDLLTIISCQVVAERGIGRGRDGAVSKAWRRAPSCRGELVEFLEKLKDVEVKEGSPVELSIVVSAASKSVAWQKDGQAIVAGGEGGYEVRKHQERLIRHFIDKELIYQHEIEC